MTKEQLFEAIGGLDESMLDENVRELPKHRYFGWIAAAAACLFCIIGAAAILPKLPLDDLLQPNTQGEEYRYPIEEIPAIQSNITYRVLSDSTPVDYYGMLEDVRELIEFTFNAEDGTYRLQNLRSNPEITAETGTYTIADNILTAVSGDLSYTFEIIDDYSLRLTAVSDAASDSCGSAVGSIFTCRYFPYIGLDVFTMDNVSIATARTNKSTETALTEEEAELLFDALKDVVIYELEEPVEYDAPITDGFVHYTIVMTSGDIYSFYVHKFFWLNNEQYLPEVSTLSKLDALSSQVTERLNAEWEEHYTNIDASDGILYHMLPENSEPGDFFTGEAMSGVLYLALNQEKNTYYMCNYLSSSYPCLGTLRKEDGYLYADGYEGVSQHKFEILDAYTLRLVETSEPLNEPYIGRLLTSRSFPKQPFADLRAEEIASVTALAYDSWEFSLSREEIETLVPYLQEIMIYDEVLMETESLASGGSVNFTITKTDGSVQTMEYCRWFWLDGKKYLPEDATLEAVQSFFWPLADRARDRATLDVQEASALLQVYAADVSSVTVRSTNADTGMTLTEDDLGTFIMLCRNQTLQTPVSMDMDDEKSITFSIVNLDGTATEIVVVDDLISINGAMFTAEAMSCKALYQFGANPTGKMLTSNNLDLFDDLELEEIEIVHAEHYASGKYADLNEEQTAEFLTLLKSVVYYGFDPSEELLYGDTLVFTITHTDGSITTISSKFVNQVRYFVGGYEPLSQFGHNVLDTAFSETTAENVISTRCGLDTIVTG